MLSAIPSNCRERSSNRLRSFATGSVLDIDEIAWIATDVILALLALFAFVGWWRWR